MTTPASGSNETDPAPGAPLSRGVVRRGWASRCRASLFSFRLPGARVPLSSEAAGPSRQRQKWRAYTGGHSERRPSNGACTRANVRQQPRSGLSRSGLTPRGGSPSPADHRNSAAKKRSLGPLGFTKNLASDTSWSKTNAITYETLRPVHGHRQLREGYRSTLSYI